MTWVSWVIQIALNVPNYGLKTLEHTGELVGAVSGCQELWRLDEYDWFLFEYLTFAKLNQRGIVSSPQWIRDNWSLEKVLEKAHTSDQEEICRVREGTYLEVFERLQIDTLDYLILEYWHGKPREAFASVLKRALGVSPKYYARCSDPGLRRAGPIQEEGFSMIVRSTVQMPPTTSQ